MNADRSEERWAKFIAKRKASDKYRDVPADSPIHDLNAQLLKGEMRPGKYLSEVNKVLGYSRVWGMRKDFLHYYSHGVDKPWKPMRFGEANTLGHVQQILPSRSQGMYTWVRRSSRRQIKMPAGQWAVFRLDRWWKLPDRHRPSDLRRFDEVRVNAQQNPFVFNYSYVLFHIDNAAKFVLDDMAPLCCRPETRGAMPNHDFFYVDCNGKRCDPWKMVPWPHDNPRSTNYARVRDLPDVHFISQEDLDRLKKRWGDFDHGTMDMMSMTKEGRKALDSIANVIFFTPTKVPYFDDWPQWVLDLKPEDRLAVSPVNVW